MCQHARPGSRATRSGAAADLPLQNIGKSQLILALHSPCHKSQHRSRGAATVIVWCGDRVAWHADHAHSISSTTRASLTPSSTAASLHDQNCDVIEAPWLVNGGHGASLNRHASAAPREFRDQQTMRHTGKSQSIWTHPRALAAGRCRPRSREPPAAG
jgi:hypothetical protein